MPIRPPALDDRNFDDLVEELLARIPAHTPEWTNPRQGDPGRTLLELFAWLGDTLLYRANLIPERQRLAFLRLLGTGLRPAVPAQGLVSIHITQPEEQSNSIALQPLCTVQGPVPFETRSELVVFPIELAPYYKRPLDVTENPDLADIVNALPQVYGFASRNTALSTSGLVAGPRAIPYTTTPVFEGGQADPTGFNLAEQTLDNTLWLALLAPTADLVDTIKQTLGGRQGGGEQVLSVGVAPAIDSPELFEAIGPRARVPHRWAISTGQQDGGETDYIDLDVLSDSSQGLTRSGVLRLKLPATRFIGAPSNNVRENLEAGVGDRPPRIDDPDISDRLVTWLRLRPDPGVNSLSLSWLGINAVEIDQRQTLRNRVVGQSNGTANQEFQLPGTSVEAETLQLQIESPGQGYLPWQQVEDLALVGSDANAYTLDSEAGIVQLGNGVQGRVPEIGMRLRVALMRSGGGERGNLAPGLLTTIQARDIQGNIVNTALQVHQRLATRGGTDPETLEAAEQRIPQFLRQRDRAITESDYEQLAAQTPGVRLGRVEVLPRFKPQEQFLDVPGVISVMVWPLKTAIAPPNPQPDRPTLEAVYAYLDERRPLGTELYVISCEYVPVGLSVAVEIADGFGREAVLSAVRTALFEFLWPLRTSLAVDGWSLGRPVQERELEVAVARVPGVSQVNDLNLFTRDTTTLWQPVTPQSPNPCAMAELLLEPWQLPELLSVVAIDGETAPTDLNQVSTPTGGDGGIAVPIVPEVC